MVDARFPTMIWHSSQYPRLVLSRTEKVAWRGSWAGLQAWVKREKLSVNVGGWEWGFHARV